MNFFCIHPGASHSTADVYNGIVRALSRQGHQLLRYDLDKRIYQSGSWLHWCYKNAQKSGMNPPKPGPADVLYHACGDAILRGLLHKQQWILLFSGMYFPKRIVEAMKRAGFRIGLVLTESPYDDAKQADVAALVDIVWTHERTSLETLRAANPATYYLAHAYDADIHQFGDRNLEPHVKGHDVVFVGTGFQERIDILSATDWTGIDFGLYGSWVLLASRSKLRKHLVANEIENEVTAALYRKAKIGLNIYRKSQGFGRHAERIETAESISLRAYELAACGLFHLSDPRPEVTEVFGDLVPTFSNAKELRELTLYYLEHEQERNDIAAKLPAAVAGHTWDARAKQLVEDIGRQFGESEINPTPKPRLEAVVNG